MLFQFRRSINDELISIHPSIRSAIELQNKDLTDVICIGSLHWLLSFNQIFKFFLESWRWSGVTEQDCKQVRLIVDMMFKLRIGTFQAGKISEFKGNELKAVLNKVT